MFRKRIGRARTSRRRARPAVRVDPRAADAAPGHARPTVALLGVALGARDRGARPSSSHGRRSAGRRASPGRSPTALGRSRARRGVAGPASPRCVVGARRAAAPVAQESAGAPGAPPRVKSQLRGAVLRHVAARPRRARPAASRGRARHPAHPRPRRPGRLLRPLPAAARARRARAGGRCSSRSRWPTGSASLHLLVTLPLIPLFMVLVGTHTEPRRPSGSGGRSSAWPATSSTSSPACRR